MDRDWFEERLDARGLTHGDLARLLNAERSLVTRMLKHGQPVLDFAQAVVVADALGVPVLEVVKRAGFEEFAARAQSEAPQSGRPGTRSAKKGKVVELRPNHTPAFQRQKAAVLGILETRARFTGRSIDEKTLDTRATAVTHAIFILRGGDPSTAIGSAADLDDPIRWFDAIKSLVDRPEDDP